MSTTGELSLLTIFGNDTNFNSINAMLDQLTILNNTINSFQPGFWQVLHDDVTVVKVQLQIPKVEKAISAATVVANSAANFTITESFAMAQIIVGQLQPQIFSSLDNIVVHKPYFTKVGGFIDVSKTVHKSLVDQKNLSAQFSAAVVDRLDPALKGAAQPILAQFTAAFDKAIEAFDSCTSLICPPALPSFMKQVHTN